MVKYEPETFWTDVAQHIAERPDGNVVAGDDTPYYRYKRARFVARFLDSLPVRGQRVLEVGCGPGGNLRALARKQPARLVGADISQAMLDLAAAMTTREHVPAGLVKVDGATLPFADAEFDVALTVTVLHHNLDADTFRALVAEICRVTNETVVIVEDTNPVVNIGLSTIERPVGEYERELAKHGFSLTGTEFLDTRATHFAHRACMKVWRTLGGRQHAEGERVGKAMDGTLRIAVTAAKPFDNLWHDQAGLTKMTFTRRR